jgi:multidrug efflux pump
MSPNPPSGLPRSRFNLSEWALTNRPLVLFFILVFAIAGALAYERLGQSEDPPFTFRVMVVKTNWPGATAHEVEQQVTDRVERKLQEVPNVDWVRSYSKPGESLVFFALKDSAPPRARPTRSTRCARRSVTSATSFRRGSRGRSSTTSSATPTPTSTR